MSNLIDYEKLWYQSNKDLAAKDAEIERLKTGLGVAGEFIKRNDLLQSQITTLEARPVQRCNKCGVTK